MKEQREHLTSPISFKTIASQKAEFDKIASSHNLTTGEWVRSILEMNKYSYGRIGEPTEKEIELLRLNKELQIKIDQHEVLTKYSDKSRNSLECKNIELQKACLELKANTTQLLKEFEVLNKNQQQTKIEKEKAEECLLKLKREISILIENGNNWSFYEIETISKLKDLTEL